jgi:predicted DNA-binding antitoxin AbrB/MazE fold protein
MTQMITATFEDGVFKPDSGLDLANGAKVQLIITPSTSAVDDRRRAWKELEQYRLEHPIDSEGHRLTRDQLHERR